MKLKLDEIYTDKQNGKTGKCINTKISGLEFSDDDCISYLGVENQLRKATVKEVVKWLSQVS
jgi:hypothetical protein